MVLWGLAAGDLVYGLCCPLPVKLQTPHGTVGGLERPRLAKPEDWQGWPGVAAEEPLARDDLADAVKYHVIPVAKAMNTDLEAGGQKVGHLDTAADVATGNGVIHHIDKVLLPPSSLADMVDTAVAAGKFGTLAAVSDKGQTGRCTG